MRKISAVAYEGNQPAAIAEKPTINSAAMQEMAANRAQPTMRNAGISATNPPATATVIAATRYRAKPPPSALRTTDSLRVNVSEVRLDLRFPATITIACPSATRPAPGSAD